MVAVPYFNPFVSGEMIDKLYIKHSSLNVIWEDVGRKMKLLHT